MDESRALRHAAWAGAISVVLLGLGISLTALVGVDEPKVSDAAILARLSDGAHQAAAGIGVPVLGLGVGLLLWFATGLRRLLDRRSGGDPLARAIVPSAALFGGLIITGVSLDVSSAITALSSPVSPDPATARVLGTAAALIGLTGLIGGAVLVAVTTRIVQRAHALSAWMIGLSYAVVVLCLSGYWGAGVGSIAFAAWLIAAAIGMLRSARRLSSDSSIAV